MRFSLTSRTICDSEGNIVGFINPLYLNREEQAHVWNAMSKLGKVAMDEAGDAWGNFEIMTYGTQKGQGSQVSCPFGRNE